jgi:NTP pyrophosphatase (non-canonical NTP hydrolase)
MNIQEISKKINENAKTKGFWDNGVDIPEKLMLIVSEVSEAMEADRVEGYCQRNEFDRVRGSYPEDHEHYLQESESWFKENVKDTFEDELADVAIRVFDLAYQMGIDLSWHIEKKVQYNASRPRMHGGKKY